LEGRIYWHILIDPWLQGGQSDVAKFFSQQWHREPSAVQTIKEVEDVIKGIEDVARGELKKMSNEDGVANIGVADSGACQEDEGVPENWIDAVVVCHEFTDHMHKETLLEIRKTVPVLAAPTAASRMRTWKHFDCVAEIPRFGGDWRKSSSDLLPDWLGISRVAYAGADLLYYHQAIMVSSWNIT
jgi:L-ascorbate metabolism protein UlaG (beta-lactamase superfamily)